MAQAAKHRFASIEHLEAFTKSLPYKVIPTNIPGAYTSPPVPEEVDLATATTTTLLKHGIPFRKPVEGDRPALHDAWNLAYGPTARQMKTIVPILQPRMGRTHNLRHPVHGSDTNFTGAQWAGGVIKGSWKSATGRWTVPTVSQPPEAQGNEGGWNSVSWVGMDGFSGTGYTGSTDVLQAGVQQLFSAQGQASYVAWFEWYVPAGVQGTIDGISAGKVVLGDQSPYQPALASLNGRLYLAWRGDGNDNINVAQVATNSNGAPTGLINKWTGGDTSTAAPALCANAGSLFLSWKGDGNDNINVAQVALDGNGAPTGLINKATLGDQTPTSPALASLDNVLYLAWKGDGNDNLNVISSDDGLTFGGKITSEETSPYTPALVANNGQLFIAWTGNGSNQLNVAVVDTDLSQGVPLGISSKVVLGDTSSTGPSLAALNGYLFLSWKGSGNDNLNVMFSQNNGANFTGKMTAGETSPESTAMAANNGAVFIAWKGDGNDNLNVAPVTLSGFTEAAYRNQTNIANFPVNPGDTMSCAVSYIGNTAGVINFANQTTGQKFSVTLAPPVGATFSGETVEWIMEAPDGGIPTSSLPKFTTVNFVAAFGCDATGKLSGNPKNGDTVNIISGRKTLTATTVADDGVTISFTG
jgi:hypothetical protein